MLESLKIVQPPPLHYRSPYADVNWNPFQRTDLIPIILVIWIATIVALIVIIRQSGKWLKKNGNTLVPQEKSGPLAPDRYSWLFFLISLVICLAGIKAEALYSMEATYLCEFVPGRSLLSVLFNSVAIYNSHNPLYRLLMHYLSVFGTGLVFYRAVSAFGIAVTTALTYQMGRTLIGRRAGLAMGLAAALCPYLVSHGRVVMPYAIMAALTLVASLTFLGMIQGHQRYRLWFTISLALGLYMHLIYAFFVIGFFAYALTQERAQRLNAVMNTLHFSAIGGLIYTPWFLGNLFYQAYMHPLFDELTVSTAVMPLTDAPVLSALEFFGNLLRLMLGLPRFAYLAGVSFFAVFILLIVPLIKRKRWDLLLFGITPFLTLIVTNAWTQYNQFSNMLLWMERYYLHLYPFLSLCVAAGIAEFLRERSKKLQTAALAVFVVFLSIQVVSLVRQVRHPQFPRMDLAAAKIREIARDGDAVLVLPQDCYGDVLHYYLMDEPRDLNELLLRTEDDGFRWYDLSSKNDARNHTPPKESAKVYLMVYNRMLPYLEMASNRRFQRLIVVNDAETNNDYWEYNILPYYEIMPRLLHQHKVVLHERYLRMELWVLETQWPADVEPGQTFVVKLGKNDYPYIDGFSRDWAIAAEGRKIVDGAAVRVKSAAGAEKIRVAIRLLNPESDSEAFQLPVRLAMGKNEQKFDLSGQGDATIQLEIDADPSSAQFVDISFGRPQPELILERVAITPIAAGD
ncbi:MAG: hypothetical protein GX444_04740 [Myxococcales bacterium]|nr:hypothetical protein [Myxococcales bacterium]